MSKENVFYCKEGSSPIALVSLNDEEECKECKKPMSLIGWMETIEKGDDDGGKVE